MARQQTNLTNSPSDDRDPAWSVDGAWIVFASNRTGNWDIYAMLSNGSGVRNITNTSTNESQPVWFNDKQLLTTNQKIAFTTDRDGDQEIYSMSINGLNQINLTNRPGDDNSPAAAPSGDRLVFVSNRNGNPDVFVMSTSGINEPDLTNNPAQDMSPAWSGDSRWIAFTSDRTGNSDIFFMSPNGTNVTDYIQSPAADTALLALNPIPNNREEVGCALTSSLLLGADCICMNPKIIFRIGSKSYIVTDQG